jgi:16S rRNA (adenine1518-N6/adenine1519-N6)-dimethyltransferase
MNDPVVPALTDAPARKALGQHFLFDPNILNRVAVAAGPVTGRTVIEVGPGPGGLTRALLNAGAAKLIAVEADPRFASALETWPEASAGRLHVRQQDARKVNWPQLIAACDGEAPAMIVANLPYNVGTPLLINWLKADAWRGNMALMFQKEVAERIAAAPGTGAYGRLAVLAQAVMHAHIAFTLPPGAFRPPPKVDSAVIVLAPLSPEARFAHLGELEQVTAAAFGQRRKMLRAALKPLAHKHGLNAEAWLEQHAIDPTERAETLPLAAFFRLAASLAQLRQVESGAPTSV